MFIITALKLLPNRRGAYIDITDVVEAAARNPSKGEGTMELLLDRRGWDLDTNERLEVVMQALLMQKGPTIDGIMKLVLDRREV